MLGLNLLVRLGRRVLAGPVADSGLLPASYYRHLVLEALEAEDFPGALNYLKWAADPLLAQILVLRLRLLAARHEKRRQAVLELLAAEGGAGWRPLAGTGQRPMLPDNTGWKPALPNKYQELLQAEDRALALLATYEARAMALLSPSGQPSN